MDDVLCLRLFGALASWGTGEAGNVQRPTQRHPGRGAVLGIAAAALGLPVGDDAGHARLGGGLLVAVAAHGPRRVLFDYRTSQTGVEKGAGLEGMTRRERLAAGPGATRITHRQSVEDGLWVAFLCAPDGGGLLGEVASALRRPAFGTCLGRVENPVALPMDPRIVPGGLRAALDAYPAVPRPPEGARSQLHAAHDAIRSRLATDGGFDLHWDAGFPGAPEGGSSRRVADDPFRRSLRTYREREERRAGMPAPVAREAAAGAGLAAEYFDGEA